MGLRWSINLLLLLAAPLVLLFFQGSCRSEKAPDYSFLREAKRAPPALYYDYIIVGGGTAGCALAATLSRSAAVLVLERGGSPYGNPNITNLESFLANLMDDSPSAPSQPFVSEDGVFNVRPRVLGGGTAVNAGFYSRASARYVKAAGWEERLVEESYEWVEKKLVFWPPVSQWQSAVGDGLLEAGVLPNNGFTYEHLIGTKAGGTIFDRQNRRHTAADLLEYADPENILVLLHATVERIEFNFSGKGGSKPKAMGVIFRDEVGIRRKAYLRDSEGEIILSAGAIGSPQLLMLSGIGPSAQLKAHGIPVILDQPMVGQDMADNPMNSLAVPSPVPVETSLVQVVGITESGNVIEAVSGPNMIESFLRTSADNTTSTTATATATMIPSGATRKGGVIVEKVVGPKSKGYMKLRSTDPEDTPHLTFNYFAEAEDLEKCVKGMRTIIKVVNSEAFSEFRYPNMTVEQLIDLVASSPVNQRQRRVGGGAGSLEQFCVDTVLTMWHYHGGCRVGRVVDGDYKVVGVGGLRIVDGSTFNGSPGTNPQATVMMLGRYVGAKIAGV